MLCNLMMQMRHLLKKMESNPSFKRDMLNRYPELKEWMKSGDMSSSPN